MNINSPYNLKEFSTAIRESSLDEDRFALLKKLIKNIKGFDLFDSQFATAQSLLKGNIAELPTGEGKTLAAVVAAICYVLDGRKVHILVFNDYLAKRDWQDNQMIYEACGICVGYVNQYSTLEQRKSAYACDVTYVSAKQAGFDYLKDFVAQSPEELAFPDFDVAIVDEADSILIDECTTPLVLAGEIPDETWLTKKIDRCIRSLTEDEYEVSIPDHLVWLTEAGVDQVESFLNLPIYDKENIEILSHIQNALKAHFLLTCDKDYIITDGAIRLVDETTGRVIANKRYPDLLHRAVEIKEKISPVPLTQIYNSIAIQDFLRLYKTLSGMTGTAATSAKELKTNYELSVDVIPPHLPSIRIDHENVIFIHKDEFIQGILEQIKVCVHRNQPCLIGSKSVAESELFSELLSEISIPHCVLNAKNDEEEAGLIARAGEPGRVTISTNMAGRGVDIRLGGIHEISREEVIQSGGLFIIGVGVNTSARIDNQLRGRAGRQGDSGESKLFVWLGEMDFVSRLTPLQMVKAEIDNHSYRNKIIKKVQRKMEVESSGARYTLNTFSEILEERRVEIYHLRQEILHGRCYFGYLEEENPRKYEEILQHAGTTGIKRAEQQLALFYINKYWAECLNALEDARSGIHLKIIGGRNPQAEYTQIVIHLCTEVSKEVRRNIISKMETLPITKDGIDMEGAGLQGGTTTWTYAINDDPLQFSAWNRLSRDIRERFSGNEGWLTKYYRRKLAKQKTLL